MLIQNIFLRFLYTFIVSHSILSVNQISIIFLENGKYEKYMKKTILIMKNIC
ncbi:hypothetical protein GCWU000323_01638 [Leptotrichia hofstadii F0254]|uniref:Uncharacterized protein n=1 Tax=Leptotrichia hofstadii F0254 TaxID=634994 RepID=C9MYK8_9FUSO|nr:hypothetical protein GCWU000323_01638 [Leptotrichia hofstadii F0254]